MAEIFIDDIFGRPGVVAKKDYEFTNVKGQTSFPVYYTVGQIDVFYNGMKLPEEDFTATDGSSVVLDTPVGETNHYVVVTVYYHDGDVTPPDAELIQDVTKLKTSRIPVEVSLTHLSKSSFYPLRIVPLDYFKETDGYSMSFDVTSIADHGASVEYNSASFKGRLGSNGWSDRMNYVQGFAVNYDDNECSIIIAGSQQEAKKVGAVYLRGGRTYRFTPDNCTFQLFERGFETDNSQFNVLDTDGRGGSQIWKKYIRETGLVDFHVINDSTQMTFNPPWANYSGNNLPTSYENLRVRKVGSLVHVSGLVRKPSTGSSIVAYLPKGMWPKQRNILACLQESGTVQRVDVFADNGRIEVQAPTSSTFGWISLDLTFVCEESN